MRTFSALRWSEWARAYYDAQRARGHSYRQALRALSAKWLKIIFVMWERQVPYDEQYHLATTATPILWDPTLAALPMPPTGLLPRQAGELLRRVS